MCFDARQERLIDSGYVLEQGRAALCDISIGRVEVPGIPGIGHVAGTIGPIEQARDLAIGIAAKNATQATRVLSIHIDNVIPVAILRATYLARAVGNDGNPDLAQLGNSAMMRRVANLLVAAESMANSPSRPARRTSSVNTDSAIVERQMFPWQTNMILIIL